MKTVNRPAWRRWKTLALGAASSGLAVLALAGAATAASVKLPGPTTTEPAEPAWQAARAAAAELAAQLARHCPLAAPGDSPAFEACRRALFDNTTLRGRLNDIVLWGRQRNPAIALKDTGLTQFAPDVLAGMYLPLFMFNGEHRVQWMASEGLFQIRLATAFRNRLSPGQFPYPFWHEDDKWATYQNASEVLLWWDPSAGIVKAAQFTTHGGRAPLQAVQWQAAHSFDGRWMWTDTNGRTQPKVSLFDGLYRNDNPYLPRLEASYKALALRLRESQCDQCHVPDNPDKSKRLVLLQTPAHAAGEIRRLLDAVRNDRMPRDQAGIEAPLDAPLKRALLEQGDAFATLLDAARGWEQQRRDATQSAASNQR